jgi:uridine kinase
VSSQNQKPFILGIAGGSGSGKTTLARELARHFGPRAHILAQDSYYIDQSRRFDGDGGSVNFDHPSSIDFPLMAQHLASLKRGKAVEVPIYDFATHTRKTTAEPFAPVPIVIAEGILLLSQPAVVAELDFSVFVAAAESVRYHRRLPPNGAALRKA